MFLRDGASASGSVRLQAHLTVQSSTIPRGSIIVVPVRSTPYGAG